jgi:hypothetical protein
MEIRLALGRLILKFWGFHFGDDAKLSVPSNL